MSDLTSDQRCVWVPIITTRGRISTMFHDTGCGRGHAPVVSAKEPWNYCPYCGKSILVSMDPFRLKAS